MHVLIAGVGAIGARAARVLSETAGVSRISLLDHEPGRADQVAKAIGARAHGIESSSPDDCPSCDAMLVALPPVADETFSISAIAKGVPLVTVGASPPSIESILEAGHAATAPVVTGAGMSPGLTEVLARHASGLFDRIDEIRVAISGYASGTGMNVARALLSDPVQVRGGTVVSVRPGVQQVAWFPEPIGERQCVRSPFGVRTLQRAFPEVPSITVWSEEPGRKQKDDWGGARIEVWGTQGARHSVVVYGFAERVAVASAVVGSVAIGAILGLMPTVLADGAPRVGVFSEFVQPVPVLKECALRGIAVATYVGEHAS